jgi:hypothetical protein
MGWLDRHTQPHFTPTAGPLSSEKDWKKNNNSASAGTTQENMKIKDYSTELYWTSNNSTCIETIASNPFYKASPPLRPLTTPYGKTKYLKEVMKPSPPLRTPHGP